MQIVKYETEEEAQRIVAEKTAQNMFLVAVSNVVEGNFLGFDDTKAPPPPMPLETRIIEMQNTLDIVLLKQEGII